MENEEKRPVGRPTRYEKKFAQKAHGYALMGLTNDQIADIFEVNRSNFYEWMNKYPELRDSIKKARLDDSIQVVKALHKRAKGYTITVKTEEVTEVKGAKVTKTIVTKKHVPAEVGAAAMLLKNRHPEQWKDRKAVVHESEQESNKEADDSYTFEVVSAEGVKIDNARLKLRKNAEGKDND